MSRGIDDSEHVVPLPLTIQAIYICKIVNIWSA
jgi:hypothetical protein